jgi:hypothetical protein
MPFKDKKKARAASREAMRRKRAGLTTKSAIETVKPELSLKSEAVKPITDKDIAMLPPSLKFQLEAQTRARKMLKLPDNLRERTEAMVRMFRGY